MGGTEDPPSPQSPRKVHTDEKQTKEGWWNGFGGASVASVARYMVDIKPARRVASSLAQASAMAGAILGNCNELADDATESQRRQKSAMRSEGGSAGPPVINQ